ncbi:Hypothetical predicted protein, partial [Paramuricea clavata]
MPRIPNNNPVLLRLLCALSIHLPMIVNVSGDLNDINVIGIVEGMLIDFGRFDLVQMLQQTMRGDLTLLEEHERNHSTQEGNPISEEMSGRTENGNVVATETQDGAQKNETCRDMEARSRHEGLSHPSEPRHWPCRNHRPRDRDRRTSRPQEGERNQLWPVLEDRPLRSPQIRTQSYPIGFAEPSFSLGTPPPEEPPLQCCICGSNIQDIQNSREVWMMITEIMNNLGLEQLRAFIDVVNNYDRSVLNTIQLLQTTSSDEIVQVLIPSLQRFHLTGRNS